VISAKAMKGLELSRRYYEEVCRPAIEKHLPDHIEKMAFGLAGDGSECYGFDDEISRDHDFGPRIMIWVLSSDYDEFGIELQQKLDKLPKNFLGFDGINTSQYGQGREGVFTINGFYKKFTGLDHPPSTIHEWSLIPEVNLSLATNGKVFSDPPGKFTGYRNILLEGYPEDLRLKMMAARCMKMAQSGQYNYARSIKRKEYVAAQMALAEFTDSAASMIYLMNKRYKPFYKWMHRGLRDLPVLGRKTSVLLETISTSAGFSDNIENIETICGLVINKLIEDGLSDSTSDFLLDHGPQVQQRIKDKNLRNMVPLG
jgi:hypothetical protein